MIEISRHQPSRFVYIHRDGRPLWGTESRTAQDAAAKAMRMDVPPGGHVEALYDEPEVSK